MGKVKFNKTSTIAQALSSSDADKIYFPTDSSSIVMNKKEYGMGTYKKPYSGIPEIDLAQTVRNKLGKVDTAISVNDTILQAMIDVRNFTIIATKDSRYNTIQVQDYVGPDDILDWIRRPIILSIEEWEGTSGAKEILTIPMSADMKHGAGGYTITFSGMYNNPDTTLAHSVSLYLPNTYYATNLVGLFVKMKQLDFGGYNYRQIGTF